MGEVWPYVGALFDEPGGREVGFNVQSCMRVEDEGYWQCEGTYINPYGCEGQLSYSGPYTDATFTGTYVITGGTGDFLGATGSISGVLDAESGFGTGLVSLE